tara:strand:- start:9276 stop:9554 length:279 start_codon:yes stop_codon:yes gene_type:complete
MKNLSKKTILLGIVIMTAGIMLVMGAVISKAEAKSPKSKFYDFSEQLIDGEIKKPTALYTDARTQVKFERLLKLKKSFIPALLDTSKDPVFK